MSDYEYDGTMIEPTCAICGWVESEHGMEGDPGHLFTRRDCEAEALEDAQQVAEITAERAREDRMHRGMELFGGTLFA